VKGVRASRSKMAVLHGQGNKEKNRHDEGRESKVKIGTARGRRINGKGECYWTEVLLDGKSLVFQTRGLGITSHQKTINW